MKSLPSILILVTSMSPITLKPYWWIENVFWLVHIIYITITLQEFGLIVEDSNKAEEYWNRYWEPLIKNSAATCVSSTNCSNTTVQQCKDSIPNPSGWAYPLIPHEWHFVGDRLWHRRRLWWLVSYWTIWTATPAFFTPLPSFWARVLSDDTDTLRRFFRTVDPKQFQTLFIQWMCDVVGADQTQQAHRHWWQSGAWKCR